MLNQAWPGVQSGLHFPRYAGLNQAEPTLKILDNQARSLLAAFRPSV
ncbi:hypothetical protein [Halomonas sp. LBP4]|nr:hypothetical protein [Halomonas sp. LBP4]